MDLIFLKREACIDGAPYGLENLSILPFLVSHSIFSV